MIDVCNMYLISGRLSGDDDDSVYIVEADSESVAKRKFKNELFNESGHYDLTDEEKASFSIHIISCTTLLSAIEERVK